MRVLIVGGPKDGETIHVPSHRNEVHFMVNSNPMRRFLYGSDEPVRRAHETVENRFRPQAIHLPNGRECTIVLAVTEEAMDAMTIPVWLKLLSDAYKEGCIL
jgi:hypothetical protein